MIEILFAQSLPRPELPIDSCEDRFAVSKLSDGGVRVAVADGASSTLFSGLWAELLAQAFVADQNRGASNLALPEIEPLRREWYQNVMRTPLPWHQQTQLSRGASAAFLGLEIAPTGEWKAISIGDCALFLVREDKCLLGFPEDDPANLAALPVLLNTHIVAHENLSLTVQETSGKWQTGDHLYLMTDALGGWFLREWKRDHAPWNWLQDLREGNAFRLRLNQLIQMRRLQEDDTTLVHLRCCLSE